MASVVISGDSSGSVTLSAPSAAGTTTQTLVATSGTLAPLVAGTAVASTSGTSIDFTSIPSWVKRVTVILSDVSTNGTSQYICQIGDSGGIENSGYTGGAGSAASAAGNSTGYLISVNQAAAGSYSGAAVLTNLSGNLWVVSGVTCGQAYTPSMFGGSKTLSATLDRVRITTVNGTDTFDAGSINIMYE